METKLTTEIKLNIIERFYIGNEHADAMQISRWYSHPGKQNFNWHEYSNYLDYLANIGVLMHAGIGNNGMQIYQKIHK